jgi:uncharacterized protein
MQRPVTFALQFRVPGWSKGASAVLNGERLELCARPGTWACIEREWHTGDHLAIRISMQLRLVPVDTQHPNRVAVMHGPVVLAMHEACCRRPLLMEPGADLPDRLIHAGPERASA